MLKNLKISKKLILGSVVVFALAIVSLAPFNSYIREEVVTEQQSIVFAKHVEDHAGELSTFFENIKSDIKLMRDADALRDLLDDNSDESRNPLENFFSNLITNKPHFMQLRYIDEKGIEIARVDNVDGRPAATVPANLQDKSDRYYFKNSMQLAEDQLYISPIDLNREGPSAAIEEPYVPVIRYALQVLDVDGTKRGIVLANIFADSFLEGLHHENADSSEHGEFYLADQDGYYIVNPDNSKLWGSERDLGTGKTLFDDFPDVASQILSEEENLLVMGGEIVASQRVVPNGEEKSFYVVSGMIPRVGAFSPFSDLGAQLTIVNAAFFLVMVGLSYLMAKKTVTDPIKRLSDVAVKIAGGDYSLRAKSDSNDEIGELAHQFNLMADNITSINLELEEKVKSKTKELETKLAEFEESNVRLKETKKAILNVMEDLEVSRERSEQERNRTEAFLTSIRDGVIVIDSNKRIVLANPAAEKMLGGKKKEMIGKSVLEAVTAIGKDKKGNFMKLDKLPIIRAFESGESRESEYYLSGAEGQRFPVGSSVAPVKDGDKVVGAVEVVRDITKQKEIDLAKSEFVSMVSHQLRTPVTTLNWYSEMILEGAEGSMDEEKIQYVHEIQRATQRMLDLINALLNVSRIELGTIPITPEETDIVEMARTVISEHRPGIDKKRINLTENFAENLPKMMLDPKIMRMVFNNLLSNSIKYTPEEGSITVDMYLDKKDGQDEHLMFKISDTGMGIPEEQKDRIFEKMFRADNIKELDVDGTGLGLYITKSVLEKFGGRVWFESELHKGSTFYVSIPITGMTKVSGAKPMTT
ncbi:MAG: ATP-binding protein [Candidatus Dojkabacteria bacterium]